MKNLNIFKSLIPILLFTINVHAQTGLADNILNSSQETKERLAYLYSKSGEGVGVYMLAGKEYDDFEDKRIQWMFNNSIKKYNVPVKIFIERTEGRNSSLYKAYVDGEGVGVTATVTDFSNYLKEAMNRYVASRGQTGIRTEH